MVNKQSLGLPIAPSFSSQKRGTFDERVGSIGHFPVVSIGLDWGLVNPTCLHWTPKGAAPAFIHYISDVRGRLIHCNGL